MSADRAVSRRSRARSLLGQAGLALTWGLVAGCPSIGSMHRARPLEVDEVEYTLGVGVYGFLDTGDDDVLVPLLQAQARRGLSEQVDAGLQVNGFGMLQVDVNYAFLETPGLVLSVDPTFSVLPVAGILASYLWLPLMADVYTDEDLTVTLSARWGHLSIDDGGDGGGLGIDTSSEFLGFGVGARYVVSDRLVLLPELHLAFPQRDGLEDDRLVSFSLGFQF